MTGEAIPMIEAIARLRDLGLTEAEIAEAFARTGPDREDPLAVAREILARDPNSQSQPAPRSESR